MSKLKRYILRGERGFIRLTLPPAGAITTALGKYVGRLYTRRWHLMGYSYYDHRFDHLRGPENWYWMERGVFGSRLIPDGGKVLDLGCGDGTFAALCYSPLAAEVDAIDRDPRAVELARDRYSGSRVRWHVRDIVVDPFPADDYDAVFLFAVLEHLSVRDGTALLGKIGSVLSPNGQFLGSTPLFNELGGHNVEHDNEFFSEKYLRTFLEPHFRRVDVWISRWPGGRNEAYFKCSMPRQLKEPALSHHIEGITTMRDTFVSTQVST